MSSLLFVYSGSFFSGVSFKLTDNQSEQHIASFIAQASLVSTFLNHIRYMDADFGLLEIRVSFNNYINKPDLMLKYCHKVIASGPSCDVDQSGHGSYTCCTH